MKTCKGYEIWQDNLGRWCVYNPASPYNRESDHKVFGTQAQAKAYVNEQLSLGK